MRVTKASLKAKYARQQRELANIGCKVCPCCGEKKSTSDYIREGYGIKKGISFVGTVYRWAEGIFTYRRVQSDRYICNTCGAEWESDPYEA